jgi:hypothetical protein
MRRLFLFAALGALTSLAAGCKPNLGTAPSVIIKPRFLAVRGTPPEAGENGMVTYDALVVDPTGTIAAPAINWAQCLQPNPPANGNDVSINCLPGQVGAEGGVITPDDTTVPAPTFAAAIPSNACTLFGPEAPPPMKGQPPQRPADPDTTGGFYQPVRAVWSDTGLVAFALERVTCNLANAPTEIATKYATEYLPNQNPVLADVLFDPAVAAAPLYAAGQAPAVATIGANQAVTLQADFSADSAETFLVWNVVTLTLDMQRESLRVSWFATGGSFEHDVTGHAGGAVAGDGGVDAATSGAGQADVPTSTQNVWHAPETPGPVYLWAVLRDNRGGIDFAAFEIDVSP